MAGKSPGPFPNCDWRFNEFPNPAAHALHVTCVELMALAVPGKDVGNALLNVVLKRSVSVVLESESVYFCRGCCQADLCPKVSAVGNSLLVPLSLLRCRDKRMTSGHIH